MSNKLRDLLQGNGWGDTFKLSGTPEDFTIHYGYMYEAPPISAELLMKLVAFFGTKSIDVDGYAESGCESCDWGSDYGHDIRIKGAVSGYAEALSIAREKENSG